MIDPKYISQMNSMISKGGAMLDQNRSGIEAAGLEVERYHQLLEKAQVMTAKMAAIKKTDTAQVKNNSKTVVSQNVGGGGSTTVLSSGVSRPSVSPTTVTKTDQGVRVQATADADNYIPVVYGEAFTQGKLTDVEMSSDGSTMWYCLTLSEFTGNHIDGTPSTIDFENIYWNNGRVTFKADGYTIEKTTDANGIDDRTIDGLVEIHCYSNGSTNPVGITGQAAPANTPAYNRMPSWTSTDAMSGLVFMIVKIFYNPARSLDNLPPITAQLKNSLTLPGDVLYDYMTNTRYGAGIPVGEINVS